MSVLDDHLKRHRQRLIDREERTFRELLAAYDEIERDLKRSYRELAKQIRDAQAAGEKISPSWLARERRLQLMLDQVEQQIVRFGGRAAPIIEREQREAINIAAQQTEDLLRVVGPSKAGTGGIGSTLTPRVVETAVGSMSDGSPLLSYFEKNLAPSVAAKLRSEIVKAAAVGTDFGTIARRLQRAGDITRSRALSMARTEVNRIRRETTRQIYEENSDVISGWEWVASKSPRTCPVCLALDGRVFKLQSEFPQHINCRCTMIAVIKGVTRPERTLGSEWFDRQPKDVQNKILGKEAGEAYRNGDVALKHFVGYVNSKEFGRSVYRKKLIHALQSSVSDRAKTIEDAFSAAGFEPQRIEAKRTNSIYVLVTRNGITAKIRISDHESRQTKGNLVDLRPSSKTSAEEIVKLAEEFTKRK
jgi:SPP1 gp7 family putative phage head morphogenesis protein